MLTLEERLVVVNLYEDLGELPGRGRADRLRPQDGQGLGGAAARKEARSRNEWAHEHRRVYRPWQSAPGDFLVVDWSEVGRVWTAAGERRLYCFCAVLGWSRWRYVRFFTCQRFQVLAQGLAGCFEELQGVPANVLFDNPKTVTASFVAGVSVLNPKLVRLATHYRFTPVTAAASDPESKGKVEALVKFVLAVHVLPVGLRPRSRRRSHRPEQSRLQLAVIHLFWHRPAQARRLGAAQVVGDRGVRQAHGGAYLAPAKPCAQTQPEDLSDLAHGRSGGGASASLLERLLGLSEGRMSRPPYFTSP
jgi:hypothetical protein